MCDFFLTLILLFNREIRLLELEAKGMVTERALGMYSITLF
jgi:hypothetical protein